MTRDQIVRIAFPPNVPENVVEREAARRLLFDVYAPSIELVAHKAIQAADSGTSLEEVRIAAWRGAVMAMRRAARFPYAPAQGFQFVSGATTYAQLKAAAPPPAANESGDALDHATPFSRLRRPIADPRAAARLADVDASIGFAQALEAVRIGYPAPAARRLAREAQVLTRRASASRLAREAQVLSLRASGKIVEEISDVLGMHQDVVRRIVEYALLLEARGLPRERRMSRIAEDTLGMEMRDRPPECSSREVRAAQREAEVLAHLASGESYREAAKAIGISGARVERIAEDARESLLARFPRSLFMD
jgi:DNA-binding CsgD family transcriptional regulator